MIRDYLKLAFANLSHRRLRSWLTMIGIFIGIASVVSLIGLGEGLRVAITGQFGFIGSDVLGIQASGIAFAGPPGSGAITPLSDRLAEKISKVNGVEAAFNRYIRYGRAEFNNRQRFAYLGSIPDGDNRKVFETMVNLKTIEGRLLKDTDKDLVLVGNDFSTTDLYGRAVRSGDRILVNG